MKNPKDLKFVNSERLQQFRGDFGDGAAPKQVRLLQVRLRAEPRQGGRPAGQQGRPALRADELNAYVDQMKQRTDTHEAGATWFPDQKQAAFSSRVASFTGEQGDMLAPDGTVKDGKDLFKDYMRIATSDQHRIPHGSRTNWTPRTSRRRRRTSTATATRTAPSPTSAAPNPFHVDPDAGPNAVKPSEYDKSGFDQGHMKPAESFSLAGSHVRELLHGQHVHPVRQHQPRRLALPRGRRARAGAGHRRQGHHHHRQRLPRRQGQPAARGQDSGTTRRTGTGWRCPRTASKPCSWSSPTAT